MNKLINIQIEASRAFNEKFKLKMSDKKKVNTFDCFKVSKDEHYDGDVNWLTI